MSRPKVFFKWYYLFLAIIGGIELWNDNFRVDIAGLIATLMMIAPVVVFVALPLHHRILGIVRMTIVILLMLFGIVFVEVWGEAKVRKWLNMPHWSEKFETQR